MKTRLSRIVPSVQRARCIGGPNSGECVCERVENMNRFPENALAAQHRLRYRSIIERQKWNVPNYCQMEFDQYDNPATKYLIYRDENYIARGVSRFCIDQTLPPQTRKRIASKIVVAYLETGLRYGIEGIVGLMHPAYWRSLFTSAGWEIQYMGEVMRLDDGNKARAAWLPVSESVLARVRADHRHS